MLIAAQLFSRTIATNMKVCCYKNCSQTGCLDARTEVKTVLPKEGLGKMCSTLLVRWGKGGEAEFHTGCWEKIESIARSRSKSHAGVVMTKEEKALVKVAAEAPEHFDSVETILREAKRAALWIKIARHCVTFTGAGISTSAGIGDYRGKAGKWTEEDQSHTVDMDSVFAGDQTGAGEPAARRQKRKLSEGQSRIEEPAGKKLKEEPELEMEENSEEEGGVPYEKLRPTYTHEALCKLMEAGYLKYVISQNGDGLHTLSGVSESRISELHGNVFQEVCEVCSTRYNRKYYVMDDIASQYYEEMEDYGRSEVRRPKHARKCDTCGLSHRTGRMCDKKACKGHLKDTIINFGDLLDEDILGRAKENAQQCDVMLCLGTTLLVTPACDLVKKGKRKNRIIICNRQETPLDGPISLKGTDGRPKGSRVFGDCDVFMREVMKQIFSEEELSAWEAERVERMTQYAKQRD